MSYLTQFDKLVRDERQMKALTGVSTQEFNFILPHFQKTSERIKEENYLERLKRKGKKQPRKSGSGSKGKLDSYEKQLFFILNYIKTYPTFDVNFNYSRSHACDKVHELSWVLLRTLKNLGYAPKRKIQSAEDFKARFKTWCIMWYNQVYETYKPTSTKIHAITRQILEIKGVPCA